MMVNAIANQTLLEENVILVKINSIHFRNAKVRNFSNLYLLRKFLPFICILACECDPEGSTELSCNADGVCSCKDNFEGDQCKACKPGYHQYPDCLGKPASISLKASQ